MAQDGRTGRRTFHGGMDRCSESQGWTTACSRMPERDGKYQGEDNPKQTGSYWFVRHCRLATSGVNLYPPGVWFADVMSPFSGVKRLVCVIFVFILELKPRPFVQSFFDMQAPRQSYHVFLPFSILFLFHYCRFLFVWRVRRTFFPFRVMFFYLLNTGCIFLHQLIM